MNVAKGIRLLGKKAFLLIQEKFHARKSFWKTYLLKEIRELNLGILIENDLIVSILLHIYADDMVLLAENEEDLQAMVILFKWRLSLNIEKANVVHFRRATTPRSDYTII